MSIKDLFKAIDPTCDIQGCQAEDDVELVVIKPFDPIDHDNKTLSLCPEHQEWADERNEFAEEMTEKMREFRRELANEYEAKADRLATPEEHTTEGRSREIPVEDMEEL